MAGFYDADSYTVDRSIGFLVLSISSLLVAALEDRLVPALGLGVSQWRALALLHDGHAATAAEVCAGLQYNSGAMTRLIDKLEASGHVAREADPGDRRTYRLKLTARGRAACERGFELARDNLNEALAGLSRGQAEQLVGSLQTMKATMQHQRAQPLRAARRR
ncbi:MAG TPA: MarR family transcriptional regulator [Kofleriaceae bacterium]